MTGAAPRVLFHSSSRRGLGHVMRAANLARAVTAADPSSSVLVHLTNEAAGAACGTDVPWVAGDPAEPGRWRRLVADFKPTLVVFDTMLPGDWADDPTPRAFVWRRSVGERHAAILASDQLRRARVLVVPHAPEEFGHELPPELARRAVFTGPIVRGTTREGQAQVRARYGLSEDTPLITSTVGGGGFDASAAWLLDVALAAHDRMAAGIPRLRHLVFRGPLAASASRCRDDKRNIAAGLTIVDSDPDLVHLIALSRLVVSEAGYNSVNEICQVGAPAFLIPGDRTFDDQARRARDQARRGVARAIGRESKEAAVDALVSLALDEPALTAMRSRLADAVPAAGNARAALALLSAAR
jgi:predicted glycosyltransferase